MERPNDLFWNNKHLLIFRHAIFKILTQTSMVNCLKDRTTYYARAISYNMF